MKSFNKFIFALAVISLLLGIILNLSIIKIKDTDNKFYNVEINRIKHQLENGDKPDLEDYSQIIGIYKYNGQKNFFDSKNQYKIINVSNELYRVEYLKDKLEKNNIIITLNLIYFILLSGLFITVFYVRIKIIKPFHRMNEIPAKLAKGDFSIDIKENKSRYFGDFVWGINMLRDELYNSKKARIENLKQEKTLLLSLSHDIKTPLSAIKLYSKALSKNIYTDKEKIIQTAENIDEKVNEIERYLNEIIKSSSDNLFNFEFDISDFYLSDVIKKVETSYKEKLFEQGIDFKIEKFLDCMIFGNSDKLFEVFSNIIENAVKYGDGHFIAINFGEEEDCRLITIKNSGCTLSDNEIDHIFDSFWRGSNVKNNAGSGLGLFICRKLMHKMNGDIFAEKYEGNMSITVVCRKSS